MVVMSQRGVWIQPAAWLLVGGLALVPARLSAQAPPPPTPEPPSAITAEDVNRVRKALETPSTLDLDENRLRYYVRILARKATLMDLIAGYDFSGGPTRRGNPMSHQEFLALVTPREMQSSGGITATETLQFAFTNWLAQTLVKKAVEDLRHASTEREVQEIRARIDRELAGLKLPSGRN